MENFSEEMNDFTVAESSYVDHKLQSLNEFDIQTQNGTNNLVRIVLYSQDIPPFSWLCMLSLLNRPYYIEQNKFPISLGNNLPISIDGNFVFTYHEFLHYLDYSNNCSDTFRNRMMISYIKDNLLEALNDYSLDFVVNPSFRFSVFDLLTYKHKNIKNW